MIEIISVRFKNGGKQYSFDPKGQQVKVGQGVILETSRGVEYGECVQANTMVADHTVVTPLRPLLRVANTADEQKREKNLEKQEKAFQICQQKIEDHGLDMKLVEAEYSFEGNKIMFSFTSENRVDFRNLVRDLAGLLHARIELRQIGVRDEAKMLGGLGICGRPFCCSQFLDDFQPVSIKMAKTQSLSLNPAKISGTCGRLMCCLKYEQDAYEDAVKRCPKQDSFVETPDGAGNVIHVNLLREKIKVKLENTTDPAKVYHNCEIRVVRNGKGKRPEDYVAPPKAELEKLRLIPEVHEVVDVALEKSSLSKALEEVFNPVKDTRPNQSGERQSSNRNSRNRRRGGKPNDGQGKSNQDENKPKGPSSGQKNGRGPAQNKPNQGGRPNPGKPNQPYKGNGNQGNKANPNPNPQSKKPQDGQVNSDDPKKANNYMRNRRRRPGGGNGGSKPPAPQA